MNVDSHVAVTTADLARLSRAIAEADSPEDIFLAVADMAQCHLGHKLFTVMAFHAESMQVRRLYSSNPCAYPRGGAKAKRETQWGRHVLEQGQPYIGYSADDIRANFDDHQTISALGLESVLNMPVRLLGRTIGTMNLLHDAGYYQESDLELASFLAAQLIGPLCMEKQSF